MFLRTWVLFLLNVQLFYISLMAVRFNPGTPTIEHRPKKTRQGQSARTKLSATSRNKKKKGYRGQGK